MNRKAKTAVDDAPSSLALNKEKRQTATTATANNNTTTNTNTSTTNTTTSGYMNGTAATTAKTKRPIAQVQDTLSAKKSKLLKTSHLHTNPHRSSPSNNQQLNLKQNRVNGNKLYAKNGDENNTNSSKLNGKKFLNKSQKTQQQNFKQSQEASIGKSSFDFDENEQEAFSLSDFSSKDQFKLGEQFYEQRLKKLNEQMRELTNFSILDSNSSSVSRLR